MTDALAGKTVAVTRTQDGGRALTDLLRARGAQVLLVPLIQFAPPQDEAALHRHLHDLSGVDWVLLTSTQGVKALFKHLDALGLPAGHLSRVKIAAVGPSTAQSLAQQGSRADFVPSSAGARYLGAELPASAGELSLHLTSQQAEPELQHALEARAVQYARAELYRTEPAALDHSLLTALRGADVVTLASGSAARHLAALAGTDFTVAVMGPQTAQAARTAGFTRITVAAQPTLEALADAAAQAASVWLPAVRPLGG